MAENENVQTTEYKTTGAELENNNLSPMVDKKEKSVAKKKKTNPNKKSLGKKIREIFSELKKVTWPKMPKILKQTGVVLVVVLIFLIIIGLSDGALSALMGVIVK